MANPEHLEILRKGVKVWNAWRQEHWLLTPDLSGGNLINMNLSEISLPHTNMERAYLIGTTLSGADLSDSELTNAILIRARLDEVNLERANLTFADLSQTILKRADASGANLGGAKCGKANLREVTLDFANLELTHLIGSDLREANCHSANFTRANLRDTDLTGANLSEADMTNATFGMTSLGGIDLSTTKGLVSIHHDGPSSVGIDTIYRSQGKIPERFLRGAGVPENFITFMKSLTGSALEFYSCFISYSTRDQGFADRLHVDLQAKGVRCWFAPHDIQGGKKVHEQIDEAIRIYDKLLLILSDASMNSNWVKTEIANARAREEQQKRQMLFPITVVPFESIREWKLFDADRGIDSAREVREYFIPDFSNWKDHDSYQKAFERLLRDLKDESRARDKEAGR